MAYQKYFVSVLGTVVYTGPMKSARLIYSILDRVFNMQPYGEFDFELVLGLDMKGE